VVKSKDLFKYTGIISIFFLAGLIIASIKNEKSNEFRRTEICLGTVVDVQVRERNSERAQRAIAKVFKEIRRVEQIFSSRSREAEVWKINHSGKGEFTVNEEIWNVLSLSKQIWQISGGGFDPTLGVLMRLWGFDTQNPSLPLKDEIQKSLLKTGFDKVSLLEGNRISKTEEIEFDFGGIAKGYAVDRAIKILKEEGINSALVNAGGEIGSIGKGWIIGVAHPRHPGLYVRRIKLEDISVATSGDYQQYFEKDGVRYHHILNPVNGYPARGLESVTIINKSCAYADALATAVFVMGREKGLKLVEDFLDTEAFLIDNNGKEWSSSGFEKFVIK